MKTSTSGALDLPGTMEHTSFMMVVEEGFSSDVGRLFPPEIKAEYMDKDGMTALAKLRDISLLSGARASVATTSANISVGCWMRVTMTFILHSKPTRLMPKDSLGRVQEIDEVSHALIDFGGDKYWVLTCQFGWISVLLPDHMFVSESGKMASVLEETLLQKRGKQEEVVKLLVALAKAVSTLDMPNSKVRTVLMYAATYRLSSVLQQLLAAGAKPKLKDTDGSTALLLACSKGNTIAAELLVVPTTAVGALDVCNETGCTALMWPVLKGLSSVVKQIFYCRRRGRRHRQGRDDGLGTCLCGASRYLGAIWS